MKRINSTQNPLVKHILQLKEKSRLRKKTGLFVVEGFREITLALKGGYILEQLLFQPETVPEDKIDRLLKAMTTATEVIEISKESYQKIAYRETTEGVLAIGKAKAQLLSDLKFKRENPLILIAEAPEKPGNIGALLRTADAADLDAVIIANPKTDMFNPNSIRSSVGCLFTNQLAVGSTVEIIEFLKEKNIAVFCASLSASTPYTTIDFRSPSAIVVGTEAEGLSQLWLDNSTANIVIPMQGVIDSMNVSVSAAILIFEAIRQRGSSG